MKLLKFLTKKTSSLNILNRKVTQYKIERSLRKFRRTMKDFIFEALHYSNSTASNVIISIILSVFLHHGLMAIYTTYRSDKVRYVIPFIAMNGLKAIDTDIKQNYKDNLNMHKIKYANDYSYY